MASADQVFEQEKKWLGGNVGMAYGPVQRWYNENIGNIGQYGWPCCQAFQTMCNGIEGALDLIPQTASCSNAAAWYKARGLYGFEPRYGAQAFFDWGDGGILDHVGFVYSFDEGYVYTIEGNTSNTVAYRAYPRNSAFIKGYGYTQYGEGSPAPEPAAPSSQWVTASQDNRWRTGPDINHPASQTYGPGANVEVVGFVYGQDPYGTGQNKWAKSKLSGLYCWQGTLQSVSHLTEVGFGGGQAKPGRQAYVTTSVDGLNWREAPTTDAPSRKSYGSGATVLCNGWRRAQDPYGDGRNIWVRSVVSGLWAWAGGIAGDAAQMLDEI